MWGPITSLTTRPAETPERGTDRYPPHYDEGYLHPRGDGDRFGPPYIAPRREVMGMSEESSRHKKTPAPWAVVSALAQVARVVLDLVRLMMDQ